ncbi:MAG: hypothetical protein ORN54_15335 [Cyclobacteriaceae bacterium]|nr:hypothetical protein [Cyclobacteriaceae bacterium]
MYLDDYGQPKTKSLDMKKLLLNVSILALISLHFSGCDLFGKKEEPKPKTELEKLPPITQEGKNTFGCLVNGKAWIAPTQTDAAGFYQLGTLQVSGSFNEPSRSLGIVLNSSSVLNTGRFELVNFPVSYCRAIIEINNTSGCFYEPENTLAGFVEIKLLDTRKYIVSGIFEFTTLTKVCDTLKVTNGRFDIKYAP